MTLSVGWNCAGLGRFLIVRHEHFITLRVNRNAAQDRRRIGNDANRLGV